MEGQTDKFFEENFMYNENFVRTATIMTRETRQTGVNNGMFLEIGGSREDSTTASKLSRYVRSDAILESE